MNFDPAGRYRGFVAFVVIFLGFTWKSKREEALLAGQFGAAFEGHRRETGFFLPRLSPPIVKSASVPASASQLGPRQRLTCGSSFRTWGSDASLESKSYHVACTGLFPPSLGVIGHHEAHRFDLVDLTVSNFENVRGRKIERLEVHIHVIDAGNAHDFHGLLVHRLPKL